MSQQASQTSFNKVKLKKHVGCGMTMIILEDYILMVLIGIAWDLT